MVVEPEALLALLPGLEQELVEVARGLRRSGLLQGGRKCVDGACPRGAAEIAGDGPRTARLKV
jgi:hypothetical protein